MGTIRTSLDPLYSARLTRAYLGASNPRRHDDSAFEAVTEVAPGDDIGLDDYHRRGIHRGAPLHLINVTINETVDGKSQIQQQDRHGLTLALGPAGLSAGVRHHAVFVPDGDDDRDDFEETAAVPRARPQALVFGPAVHDDDEDGERLPVFAWEQPANGIAPVCEGARLYAAEPLTLGHWLGIAQGRIRHYQIVAPTTWNFSPRDADGVPGPLEQALAGTPVGAQETVPLAVQHVVRSFDPCMSCTVH